LLLAGTFFISCKKEYVDYPYNTIEKFVVTDNTKAAIEASITESKIIVYWPPQQAVPDSITPVITVSDRATISPASGTKVAFKQTTIYTITAQDGGTRKFTLTPSVNQPLVYFNFAGSNIQNLGIGKPFAIIGENFIVDTAETKFFLVDKNKKEIQVPASNFTSFTTTGIRGSIPVTSAIDTGNYTFKLVSGIRQAVQGPYHVGKPDLTVTTTMTSVKKGGTLIFDTDPVIAKYNKVGIAVIYDEFFNPFIIENVSQSDIKISVPIPSVFDISSTSYIEFYDKDQNLLGGWYEAGVISIVN